MLIATATIGLAILILVLSGEFSDGVIVRHPGDSFAVQSHVLISFQNRAGNVILLAPQIEQLMRHSTYHVLNGVTISNVTMSVSSDIRGTPLNLKCDVALSSNLPPGEKDLTFSFPEITNLMKSLSAKFVVLDTNADFNSTDGWKFAKVRVESRK